MAAKKNSIITSGFRKTSVARATVTKGKGAITINNQTIDEYNANLNAQLKIKEPLLLSGLAEKYDFKIVVFGGGTNSQTDAIRQSIARGLVEITDSSDLKKTFVEYDRSLLVADTRYKEKNKPNNSNPRAKRQKSYR